MEQFLPWRDLLFTLLLKVGAAGALAAVLVRSMTFRRVLYTEERDFDQKMRLMVLLIPPLAIGVSLRLAGSAYNFADLMMTGSFLLGLLGGRVVGPVGAAIISLPAFAKPHHEWLAMPLAASAGLLGGLIRQFMPNKEDIWNFGPFTFLGIPRWLWRMVKERRAGWEMLPMAGCVALAVGKQALGQAVQGRWMSYTPLHGFWQWTMGIAATIMCVAVPIKIWNSARLEMNLEQHQQLLLKARMDALSSQINPHFLFNTLNTVSSLIRYDPDRARVVVLRLSNILRRLLRKHETFVPLHEELDFVDDYLDIEVARFGHDNLQIVKEVEKDTLEAFVPSMLLQPIVENSIKHGISARLDGGRVTIRTSTSAGRLVIEVEDNGVGIPEERMARVYEEGIGISNVHERLRVLYGDNFRMDISSQEGLGTRIRIEVPELVSEMPHA
jgi:two-component system, LytTR family, sensor kinase